MLLTQERCKNKVIFHFFRAAGRLALWAALAAWALNAAAQGPPATPVSVQSAEQRIVSNQVALIGTVTPVLESLVASEVAGVVDHYPVKEGDFVRRGDVLVRLRARERLLMRSAAEAARGRIHEQHLLAAKELERFRKLKKSDSIAESRYDEALHHYQSLTQQLRQSEAEIARLDYVIQQTQVLAPFSGFVAAEHTQIGEWVSPGGAVAKLLDLHNVLIEVDVPERYITQLASAKPVQVSIASLDGETFSGKIYAVLPEGDPRARSFPVKVVLENPQARIKSGMEATVRFGLTDTREALLVPKDALVLAGSDRLVYAVHDGKAVPVKVTIAGYFDAHVAVEGDLKPGTPVVVRGNERLRPGQPVAIRE